MSEETKKRPRTAKGHANDLRRSVDRINAKITALKGIGTTVELALTGQGFLSVERIIRNQPEEL